MRKKDTFLRINYQTLSLTYTLPIFNFGDIMYELSLFPIYLLGTKLKCYLGLYTYYCGMDRFGSIK